MLVAAIALLLLITVALASNFQEGPPLKGEVVKAELIDKNKRDWKLMDDPTDAKPADWVEETEVIDPEAKEPEGWDKEADGEHLQAALRTADLQHAAMPATAFPLPVPRF